MACVPQRVSAKNKVLGELMLEFKEVCVVSCCQWHQKEGKGHPGHKGCGIRRHMLKHCFFLGTWDIPPGFSMTYYAVTHSYFYFSTYSNLDLPGELAGLRLGTSWKPPQKGIMWNAFVTETDLKVCLYRNQECCVLNLAPGQEEEDGGSNAKGIRKCGFWSWLFPNYLCGL